MILSFKIELSIADNSSQLIQGHNLRLSWFGRVQKDLWDSR